MTVMEELLQLQQRSSKSRSSIITNHPLKPNRVDDGGTERSLLSWSWVDPDYQLLDDGNMVTSFSVPVH